METMDDALDTLSTARRLEQEYGMDARAAEGVAVAIHEHVTENLATKQDLHLLGSQLRGEMQSLRGDMEGLRADVATEFKTLYRHLWVMQVGFAALIVTLMKLLP